MTSTIPDKTFPHFLSQSSSATRQLHVDGNPYLILGAELQNSSLSSSEYMAPIWPRLAAMNINTILGNVTWEHIEPVEENFDFEELDKAIEEARKWGIRLVLLWFGSFKNGLSTYTPAWVKTNPQKFPRVKLRKGSGVLQTADIVSLFSKETRNADAKAFSTFMRHLKEVDGEKRTVIMVQVQNEVGIIGDSRDASRGANKAFESNVPDEVTKYLSQNWDTLHPDLKSNLTHFHSLTTRSGTWEQVFGTSSPQTDELFMAYHYAKYVEYISHAGAQEYPLPLFTNVWLNNEGSDRDSSLSIPTAAGGGVPGHYPSGGPLPNVLDVWQAFAPTLEFIGPDIYLADYDKICRKYKHRDQVLFIPEQRSDEYGARRIWKAIGSYGAIGVAPFGIDTVPMEKDAFTLHYKLLSQVRYHILEAHRNPGSSFGFYFDEIAIDGRDPSPPMTTNFGDWEVKISRAFVFGKQGPAAGMVIRLGANKFLLVGFGYMCKWRNTRKESVFTGLLSFTEMVGDVKTGVLRMGRKLNGDESESGKLCIMPSEKPDNGDFPIPLCMPAGTMIAECEVYSLEADDVQED